MKKHNFCLFAGVLLTVSPGPAQVVLNTFPSRVVGQTQLPVTADEPNLVEGRELYLPYGIAADASGSNTILYVADTANNRILAWKNATTFGNGAQADLVIGQKDMQSTFAQGPGWPNSTSSSGLAAPMSLAVDATGNLYVSDAANNRILRYPQPFNQPGTVLPDMVIGQQNLNSKQPNATGINANTINTNANPGGLNVVQVTSLAFDGNGNLWFTDSGNYRVLRYPFARLQAGGNFPAADLVIGQSDLSTVETVTGTGAPARGDRLNSPSGLAFDANGRLIVTEGVVVNSGSQGLNRILVFTPPFSNGQTAARVVTSPLNCALPATDHNFCSPRRVFVINNFPYVVDQLYNRILRFDPFDSWPASQAPSAHQIMGQDGAGGYQSNKNAADASASSLATPGAGVFARGTLYVADTGNHRVLAYPDPSNSLANPSATRVLGQTAFEFNTPNLIEGREFNTPSSIAIDNSDGVPHLYVADTGNNRVLGFKDARFAKAGGKADLVFGQVDFNRSIINSPGNDPNSPTLTGMYQPYAVAVDAAGNLWVADTGNGRALRFPKPFSQAGAQNPDIVIGQSGFTTKIQDPTNRTMSAPSGIAFTGTGNLLVSDQAHSRVLLFLSPLSTGMTASKVFGQADFTSAARGNGANRMNGPRLIAVDVDDRLYITDQNNNRILIYDTVTGLPDTNASSAVALVQGAAGVGLARPSGVAINSATGEIWVADTNNFRFWRYPKFLTLLGTPNVASDASISTIVPPLSLTFDPSGNLITSDSFHRVTFYYQAFRGVNNANYALTRVGDQTFRGQEMVPGMVASLGTLGPPFAATTASAVPPLPNALADTQVLVNGVAAPLYYVSSSLINFVVPWKTPQSGSVDVQVVRASTGEIIAVGCTTQQTGGTRPDLADATWTCAGAVQGGTASPGLYTLAGATGQVAAVNQDGTINGPNNAISRGQVIQLYGTGHGLVANPPADGAPPTSLTTARCTSSFNLIMGSQDITPSVQFSGLSPSYPGLWQINVTVPTSVSPSNTTDVVVVCNGLPSNLLNSTVLHTTIAVKQ